MFWFCGLHTQGATRKREFFPGCGSTATCPKLVHTDGAVGLLPKSVRPDTAAEGRLLPGEVGCKIEQNEVSPDTAQKESTGMWDPEAEITIRGGEGVIAILVNENIPFSVQEGLAT